MAPAMVGVKPASDTQLAIAYSGLLQVAGRLRLMLGHAVSGKVVVPWIPENKRPIIVTEARATPAATVLALRAALAEVAADPALAPARAALFLRDIVPASVHRYVALRGLAHAAAARGYPALR